MATSPESQDTDNTLAELKSSARFIFGGLAWGALMLFTLGFWLRAKYDAASAIWGNAILLVGVVALLLAAWQAFTLWFQTLPDHDKATALTNQRRLFSLIFMAGGFALLVLAFVLGMGKKPSGVGFVIDNLGESLSLLVFALATLAAGFCLTSSTEPSGSGFIPAVRRAFPMLRVAFPALSLAIIALLIFLYLRRGQDFFFAWIPELLGLFFLSVLFVSCFFWINTGTFDDVGTRLFVLIFGGTAGLIVFIHALGRAYLWREDIFLGGVDAWQGEQAWRFWLCSYVLFASLVLTFASLYAAEADIRQSVILRRLIYGFTAIAQGLLLAGILFVLMVVLYTHYPMSFDFTNTRGIYDLSTSSKNLLKNLKNEVNVVVMLSTNETAFKDTRHLLGNCQAISNNKLKVEYVSPDQSPREYLNLAKRFPQIQPDPRTGGGRGVLVVNGPMPTKDKHDTKYSFIPTSKLLTIDEEAAQGGGRMRKTFKGEDEIMRELKFLAQNQERRKIYFLQGNDEMNFANKGGGQRRSLLDGFSSVGIGIWADSLKKENYEVLGLSFKDELPGEKNPGLVHAAPATGGTTKEVPEDCYLLVIAGASKQIPGDTLTAIERYMDRGPKGKLLVLLDVVVERDYSKLKSTGLESLLKRYSVDVADEFVMHFPTGDDPDPYSLTAQPTPGSQHPLAVPFERDAIFMENSARVVRPAEGAPGRFKAESIWSIEPEPFPIFAEKDTRVVNDYSSYFKPLLENRKKLQELRSRAPVSVGVVVTEGKGDAPRMVVMGDSEFLSNMEFARSRTRETNRAFAMSVLEIMAGRESTGAQPRISSVYQVPAGGANIYIFLPGWIMLLTLFTIGTAIWIVRRR